MLLSSVILLIQKLLSAHMLVLFRVVIAVINNVSHLRVITLKVVYCASYWSILSIYNSDFGIVFSAVAVKILNILSVVWIRIIWQSICRLDFIIGKHLQFKPFLYHFSSRTVCISSLLDETRWTTISKIALNKLSGQRTTVSSQLWSPLLEFFYWALIIKIDL